MIYFLAIKNSINNQMSLNDKIMNLLNTMSWVTKRIKLVLSKCCGVAWIGGAHCWMLWSIKIKTTCVEWTGINNEWLESWMFCLVTTDSPVQPDIMTVWLTGAYFRSSLSVCAGRSGQVSGQVGSSRLLSPGSARSRVAPCQHYSQTPFTSVCSRHREYGGHSGLDCIDGRPEDNFVMQLPEENAQYLVYRDRKQIYLDWLPGQKTRRVKLIFICSNRCFVETETEYYINLKISLEEPISGDLKGYDTVAVIPPW